MKILKLLMIFFILITSSQLKSEENNEELNKILKNIRCLICQGQSVFDSDSDFALSVKLIVKKRIKEGMSEEQIYEYLKEKYGEWILYNPRFTKKTLVLWIMPILLFIGGGGIIFRKLIKKNI
jgi:cytochrome c-type biogenesis protein CcmH